MAMIWFAADDPADVLQRRDYARAVGHRTGQVLHRRARFGRIVVLQRNKFYTGSAPTTADQIVFTVAVGREPEHPADQGGPGGLHDTPAAAAAAALGEQYGVNKKQFFVKPTLVTSWWALNTQPGTPFANVNLRKAVNWAIDRPAQVRVAGKYGGRRTDQLLPPAMQGFTLNNSLYAYAGANVAKAKAVAGNVSSVPTIRILHRNSASNVARGQLMQYELEAIGLKAKTESIPSSQLFSRAGSPKTGGYDMAALGWQADYPDPENFINVLFDGAQIPSGDGASNNWSFFNSPKYNALMKKAALTAGDARYKAYGALDIQMMKDAAPAAPYINSNNRIFVSSRISNFTYNDANTYTAWNALVIK